MAGRPKRVSSIGPNGQASPPAERSRAAAGSSIEQSWSTQYNGLWELASSAQVCSSDLQMMRSLDGQARGLYSVLTMPIIAGLKGATVTPPSGEVGGDEEAAFIRNLLFAPPNMGGMITPFRKFVGQLCLALFDGMSAFEFEYARPDSGPMAGKWTIEKLGFRPPNTVRVLADDKGRYAGLHQQINTPGQTRDVIIPGAHSFIYAAREEEREFYGHSYFESAYNVWTHKFKLTQVMHMAAMRAATGTRVGTFPSVASHTDVEDFRKALDDFAFANSITKPAGYEVEILREATSFDFLAYLNMYNSQMSKSVLAQFIDESQGTGGDTAVVKFGGQSDSYFLMQLDAIMAEMADVINTYVIPRFIDWNFGTAKYPTFVWGSVDSAQKNAINQTFKDIFTAASTEDGVPREVRLGLIKRQVEELGLEVDMDAVAQRLAKEWKAADKKVPATTEVDEAELEARKAVAAAQVAESEAAVEAAQQPEATPGAVTADEMAGVKLPEGFKLSRVVRDERGAKWFGQPVGSVVQDDRKTPKIPKPKTTATSAKDPVVLGGETKLVDPGGSGICLVQFSDGTVVLRTPDGRETTRQKFDVVEFEKLGWKAPGTPKEAKTNVK